MKTLSTHITESFQINESKGKVIGTTKSGRKVYKDYQEDFKEFSKDEHLEAAQFHFAIANKVFVGSRKTSKVYKIQNILGNSHMDWAKQGEKKTTEKEMYGSIRNMNTTIHTL